LLHSKRFSIFDNKKDMRLETEFETTLHKLLDEVSTQHDSIKIIHHFSLFNNQAISSQQWQTLHSVVPDSIIKALPKRQSSFFNGRLCAEQTLIKLGESPRLNIGKLKQPIWPNGVIGSISHCDGMALAIATSQMNIHGIGIDIESILDSKTLNAIRQSALSEDERNRIPDWKQDIGLCENTLVTVIFSLKESFYKSVFNYVNRVLEFNAIEVINITAQKVEFIIKEQSVLESLIQQDVIQGIHLQGHYDLQENHTITCVII